MGIVECSYKVRYQDFFHTGKLEGKFVSGDDPSPEAGVNKRIEIDALKRLDIGFFAVTCNTKNFNVEVSTFAWTFLKPRDFENWKRLTETINERFLTIPFDGTEFSKKADSTDDQLSLEITCLGKPRP